MYQGLPADEEPTERVWPEDVGCLTERATMVFGLPRSELQVITLPTLVPFEMQKPRAFRWDLAMFGALGWSLGAVTTAAMLAGVALTGGMVLAAVALACVEALPGGHEQLEAESLSVLRQRIPALIEPIEDLELLVQTASWSSSLALSGAPAEPTFELPMERIADAPLDIPSFGPQQVPEVPFDPALLAIPLSFVPAEGGPSWLSVARPVLNEAFPGDAALVLRFDAQQAELHWQPGRLDPWPVRDHQLLPDAVPGPDRTGRVPASDRSEPFVAFGGGFQSIHFPHFGARWHGHDIVPLQNGLQTLALYEDGHAEIGPWGTLPRAGLSDARQNLPPLVHDGKIPAEIAYLNAGSLSAERKVEGGLRTYTNVHTWRSALGQLENGDLVYVLAARVTPQQLAATLIRAGVVEGMQLDINAAWYASPTLFQPGSPRPRSTPLFTGLEDGGRRFSSGADRDFFYLAPRSP